MSFTNKDRKRLESAIRWKGYPDTYNLTELLARLDAAERVAEDQALIHDPRRHEYEYDEEKCFQCQKIRAWLKSAGKPQGEERA